MTSKSALLDVQHCTRYQYTGIKDRKPYQWPENKKLAVFLALNVEVFSFADEHSIGLIGDQPAPYVAAYAWKEYGNRVGAWRLLDLFQEFNFPCAMLLNSQLYNHCPELMAYSASLGNEVVAHSRTNSEWQGTKSEEDEQLLIKDTTDTIKKHEGKAPSGWLGSGLSESYVTPDLLEEAGYNYVMDFGTLDDQPIWMSTRSGRKLLAIPYAQDLNDFPAILQRHWTYKQYADAIIDAFDEMLRLAEAGENALVMPVSLHTFLVGQPLALPHLRRVLQYITEHLKDVWVTTPGEVFNHVKALPSGTVPGDGQFQKSHSYLQSK